MAKKDIVPEYPEVIIRGKTYNRACLVNADGKSIQLYAINRDKLHKKVQEAEKKIKEEALLRKNPTVGEYSRKWLCMYSIGIRETTLSIYSQLIERYIIPSIGNLHVSEVTADDIKVTLSRLTDKSTSTYASVHMLLKLIFESAEESNIISNSPFVRIPSRGGQKPKVVESLTDDQVDRLLCAIKGLPPYVFVMLGLYAGLRREEILALQWDCVHLGSKTPYISVRRAWHTENNRPVILSELKTNASKRDIPIPKQLVICLAEAKRISKSEYVVASSEGKPLSESQFRRLWQYINTRSIFARKIYVYRNGEKKVKTIVPAKGQSDLHNKHVLYSIDFRVTPHQLRHTYITNLIFAGVDPKTVQYLAGHKNSKVTMDIYAKVKYHNPQDIYYRISEAFSEASSL